MSESIVGYAAIGNVEGLEKLLLLPDADVNEKDDEHGETALSWAAEYGHDEAVDLLLQHSPYISIRDNYGRTPLSWAARNGHAVIVKRLLEKGANEPEPKDQTNRTPLSLAAQEGHHEIMKLLIDYHSQIDSLDSFGQTPLFFAAKNEHKDAVQLLINKTDKVDLNDENIRVALSWVAKKSMKELLTSSLKKGLKLTATDSENARRSLFWAAEAGQSSILSFLLTSQDLDPDTKNEQGRTPLSLAARDGHESVVKFLLSDDLRTKVSAGRAVFVDSRDKTGRSSLSWAAGNGHLSVVRLLIDKGADIGLKTHDGSKMLYFVDEAIDMAEKNEEEGEDKTSTLQDIRTLFNELRPDGTLQKELQKETNYADRGYSATIMHCLKDKKIKPPERYHITTMLEGEPIRKAKSSKESSCIWFHLPANNMTWVETLMAKLYEGTNNSEEHNVILKSENWTDLQHLAPEGVPHARYMSPTCKILRPHTKMITSLDRKSPDPQSNQNTSDAAMADPSRSPQKGFVLFMPYLHWELKAELEEMRFIVGKKVAHTEDPPCKHAWSALPKLVWAYLHTPHPLHLRRTLDQYYYHTLGDTTERDESQTGSRYHKKHEKDKGFEDFKEVVTMVDQLWLWVLPQVGDSPPLVVTSFPQRANRRKSNGILNTTALVLNVIRKCQSRKNPITTGYDLAEIISSECTRIYLRTTSHRPLPLKFLEIYHSSIADIADKEVRCFEAFKMSVKKPVVTDSVITEEIKLLHEIKDIRDELNIMSSVSQAQKKVLGIMAKMDPNYIQLPPDSPNPSMNNEPAEENQEQETPLTTVNFNIAKLNELDNYAERVYMALNHLLDLKQKQASFLESKATHKLILKANSQAEATYELSEKATKQAEATNSQGNKIMFFTIITIIFIPLSFMSAFFAINIAEFPRGPNGLSLGYVSKYMFSMSAAFIVPAIFMASKLESITKLLKKLAIFIASKRKSVIEFWWKKITKRANGKEANADKKLVDEEGTNGKDAKTGKKKSMDEEESIGS